MKPFSTNCEKIVNPERAFYWDKFYKRDSKKEIENRLTFSFHSFPIPHIFGNLPFLVHVILFKSCDQDFSFFRVLNISGVVFAVEKRWWSWHTESKQFLVIFDVLVELLCQCNSFHCKVALYVGDVGLEINLFLN